MNIIVSHQSIFDYNIWVILMTIGLPFLIVSLAVLVLVLVINTFSGDNKIQYSSLILKTSFIMVIISGVLVGLGYMESNRIQDEIIDDHRENIAKKFQEELVEYDINVSCDDHKDSLLCGGDDLSPVVSDSDPLVLIPELDTHFDEIIVRIIMMEDIDSDMVNEN